MIKLKIVLLIIASIAGGVMLSSMVTSTSPSNNDNEGSIAAGNQINNLSQEANLPKPKTASEAYQQTLKKQQSESLLSPEQLEQRQNELAQIARNADETKKVIIPTHLKPATTTANDSFDNLSVEELAKTFGAELIKRDKVTLLRRNNELFTEQQVRFILKRLHSTPTNS